MQPKFLCMGLIMRDVLLCGVKELPAHWEQTLAADAVVSDTGGGAANSARTLGRLGAAVSLSGRVGNDGFGEAVRASLQADGVALSQLVTDEEAPSGLAVALVREDGKRCFTTVRGANSRYAAGDLSGIRWEEYPFVHVNGYFQFPTLEKDLPVLLAQAKAAGCTVSFDTASWDPAGRWFESIRPFAACIDYFFANDAQLRELTGEQEPDWAAAFLMERGVKHVIAKLGGCGSISFGGGEKTAVEAYPVAVTDTTGAGDSFDAAYMLGVSKGWSTHHCAKFANTVAGLNCAQRGATAGVPDFDTALRLSDRNYGCNPCGA